MTTETLEQPVQSFAEHKAERAAPPKEPPGEVVGEAKEVLEVEAVEEVEEAPKPKAKKPPPAMVPYERMSEALAERRMVEDRLAAAERERDELKAKLAPPPKAESDEAPEPKQADYADAFEFARDLAEWSTHKALKERDKAEAAKVANAEREKVTKAWSGRVNEVKAELPDYDEVMSASEVMVSDAVRDTLIESAKDGGQGIRLMYAMAKDPAIAEKLSGMSVLRQVAEVGRLMAQFDVAEAAPEVEKPKPVARPKAPAPIEPVRGGRAADNPVDEPGEFRGTFAQWKAARNNFRKSH